MCISLIVSASEVGCFVLSYVALPFAFCCDSELVGSYYYDSPVYNIHIFLLHGLSFSYHIAGALNIRGLPTLSLFCVLQIFSPSLFLY